MTTFINDEMEMFFDNSDGNISDEEQIKLQYLDSIFDDCWFDGCQAKSVYILKNRFEVV